MRISSFFSLTSLAVSGFAQVTINTVLADISTMVTLTSALNNSINSFPSTGGTIFQALALYTSAIGLSNAIDLTTANVKALPLPVSEADGQSVFAPLEPLTLIIVSTLNNTVAKKPTAVAVTFPIPIIGSGSILSISAPALVKQVLVKMNASASALGSELLATCPASFVPLGSALKSQVDNAFAQAIAAYT